MLKMSFFEIETEIFIVTLFLLFLYINETQCL